MAALLVLAFSALASAGTLSLGTPVVQNNQYTFPVNLQGNAVGVAALDFRLSYDPAVFSPVSAQSGSAALTAQKQVSSNVAEPGEFVVVMMGFNQNEVQPGTVVHLVLEKIGEPANGQSELLIAEPTMATYEGVELDSNGQARVVRFGEEKAEDEVTQEPAPIEEDTAAETPPEESDSPDLDPSRPTGSFRFIVAEDTENKAKAANAPKSTDAGASPPTPVDSEDLGANAGGGGGADLPPGSPSGGATPGSTPMTAASEPVLNSTDSGIANEAQDNAMLATGDEPTDAVPAPAGESGNRRMLFATLLLVAVALPISALVILKALR